MLRDLAPRIEAWVLRGDDTRIIRAGIRTVVANAGLLNPLRYPLFAWQLWSHKALKWLFPFLVVAHVIVGGALWEHGLVYRLTLVLYGVFILMGVTGLFVPGRPIRKATFLLLSSAAVLAAWYKVIFGGKTTTWEPSHR